ncbi:hypothetical protein [Acidobacterium sp. S8]|uniref:hypothetical protein n=1 Tax=Acidobacterium sp. S8 TaxID=1641854 RepID=UPI00131AC44C|nr:hypothetical protein [Acidobacterium sp. S8]
MSQAHQNEARTIELAKIAGTEEDIALIQQHVKEVVEGAAFKGSHRSGQFLKYIVDQAIAGHFESLKERVIGVELFGRAPSYDTGDDAIVRVTASDVRKRLLQHYGRYGSISQFRISLPLGSYIPEIWRDTPPVAGSPHQEAAHEVQHPHSEAVTHPNGHIVSSEISVPAPAPLTTIADLNQKKRRRWLAACLVLTIANVALWGILWNHFARRRTEASSTLPWSVLFNSPHALQLITSDPDIGEIQGYTDQQISVSDYANHNYIPNPDKLTPGISQLCQILLRGNKASLVDTPIAVSIAELAQANSKKIEVHPARSVQLPNLQTDDNFVLLGSPRSNPWSTFFSDQLNFRFVYDKNSGQEIIRNLHPRPHEQAQYVPTALGWATGQSYAIVALVRNPDQNGQVLLLGGANAEGTEAASKLVTDLPRLTAALGDCGIPPGGALQHFELLLRLNMMTGSPTNVNVEACHILPDSAAH